LLDRDPGLHILSPTFVFTFEFLRTHFCHLMIATDASRATRQLSFQALFRWSFLFLMF
jgi:hypothetical protein